MKSCERYGPHNQCSINPKINCYIFLCQNIKLEILSIKVLPLMFAIQISGSKNVYAFFSEKKCKLIFLRYCFILQTWYEHLYVCTYNIYFPYENMVFFLCIFLGYPLIPVCTKLY